MCRMRSWSHASSCDICATIALTRFRRTIYGTSRYMLRTLIAIYISFADTHLGKKVLHIRTNFIFVCIITSRILFITRNQNMYCKVFFPDRKDKKKIERTGVIRLCIKRRKKKAMAIYRFDSRAFACELQGVLNRKRNWNLSRESEAT